MASNSPKQKKTVGIEIEGHEKNAAPQQSWKPIFQEEEKLHWKNRKPSSAGIEVKQNRPVDINDRVSDYINRAKIRIRSVTMRGDHGGEGKGKGKGKAGAAHGQGHDGRFADYIHRMRMKLRTTSTVGTGKDVAAK